MSHPNRLLHIRKRGILANAMLALMFFFAGHFYLYGQNKSDFPAGYDAIEAAPDTHKIIFENEFVRVLEVTVPAPGVTIPMHHHRWPSFFLDWDTGGSTPHIRYHRPDGSVTDNPSREFPVHPGAWSVQWMKPEPLHSIEVVEKPKSASTLPEGPPGLRIEIKCHL
jgi:hypothetical protein